MFFDNNFTNQFFKRIVLTVSFIGPFERMLALQRFYSRRSVLGRLFQFDIVAFG